MYNEKNILGKVHKFAFVPHCMGTVAIGIQVLCIDKERYKIFDINY